MRPEGQPPQGGPPTAGGYPYAWQGPGYAPTAVTSPPPRRPRRTRTVLTVVLAAAVVAAAAATTALVLRGGDGSSDGGGEEHPVGARPAPDDPRRSMVEKPDPVVAPDWRVQTNADKHSAFDVPPEWKTNSEDTYVGYNDDREGAEPGTLLVAMSGPSEYLYGWCAEADNPSARSMAGTKAGQGASGTEEAARNEAMNWVLAAYDQEQLGTFEITEPEPFTSEHGITGHTVTATVTDLAENRHEPCEAPEGGKAVTFSFIDAQGDLATWVLLTDTGFPEEPSQETIDAMMNSLRPYAVD
ncbi:MULTISPECIES: hypothetical protein [Streptomyces]|uniref:hypothetical protein n=1 Tax=Streptomyces TaxID=1883 RepID=UPI001319FB56|nr:MULTISPECIES: hypothetical protein [Streptomyces]